MKINFKKIEMDDYREGYEVYINGEEFMCFYDGEPEDNCICRNFNDVYKIPELITKVVEAIRQGEEVIY